MNTHTLRWNGSKAWRIVKFTKPFLALLQKSNEESVALIISKMLKDLKTITGEDHKMDFDSLEALESVLGKGMKTVVRKDYKHHMIINWFKEGYLHSTLGDPEKDLQILNEFFDKFV